MSIGLIRHIDDDSGRDTEYLSGHREHPSHCFKDHTLNFLHY